MKLSRCFFILIFALKMNGMSTLLKKCLLVPSAPVRLNAKLPLKHDSKRNLVYRILGYNSGYTSLPTSQAIITAFTRAAQEIAAPSTSHNCYLPPYFPHYDKTGIYCAQVCNKATKESRLYSFESRHDLYSSSTVTFFYNDFVFYIPFR